MNSHQYLVEFAIVAGAHILAVMSPGPDFALIVKSSLSQTRKIAILTALGIALGICIHISYCLFGIAILILKFPALYSIIRYLGASYLIYLGIQCLLETGRAHKIRNAVEKKFKPMNPAKSVFTGFLTNALNPKATLFFLSLFTQVVRTDTPWWIQSLYGMEMIAATFIWFSCVALFITTPRFKGRFERALVFLVPAMGVLLLAFGLKLFIS
ncbi:MAG: lysine transporter LysE [Bacteriovoracaceae bacterium]|nr:lysine transporter LysE [Bacteriovoracaceae bacterium]